MNNELYHYGVLGMKWGIRRSPQQLGRKISRLANENAKLKENVDNMNSLAKRYDAKSVKAMNKNSKYEARLAKATAKKAKYDVKLAKAQSRRHVNTDKVAELAGKSAKQQLKIDKAKRKIRYNKWAVKSEKVKQQAIKAQDHIAKNENAIKIYNSTIRDLNSGKIEQGRLFMQYSSDD